MNASTVVLDDDDSRRSSPARARRAARPARSRAARLLRRTAEKSARTFVDDRRRALRAVGDFARPEADGTVTVFGRGSQCINSGGEKIFPEEVEGALKSHPDVFDAVVVGVPDARWGEARGGVDAAARRVATLAATT